MTPKVALTAYGLVGGLGVAGTASGGSWLPFPANGERFPDPNRRPFRRFGKLDALSQAVVAAAEMLGLSLLEEDLPPREWGLVLASAFGCLDVDYFYHLSREEPAGPSPLLFMYTLPSSPLGQLAIRHRVVGPNLCLLTQGLPGIEAVVEGFHLVDNREAPACICVCADSLSPEAARMVSGEACGDASARHEAAAFLLESWPPSEDEGRSVLAWLDLTAPSEVTEPGHSWAGRKALTQLRQGLTENASGVKETITFSTGQDVGGQAVQLRWA